MYIPCEASSWTLLHQNRKLSSRISLQNQLFCLCRLPAVVQLNALTMARSAFTVTSMISFILRTHVYTLYVFIDVLKQIQTTTFIKIRGLDNPATVRRTEKEKLAFSLEQYRRLETGEISRATYMKSMGLKFSATTDL